MSDEEMRELDAWIADRVMGWTALRRPNRMKDKEFFFEGDVVWVNVGYRGGMSQFSPTTDPAAAFEVLKKIGQQCGEVRIYFSGTAQHPRFQVGDGPKAETFELAIAL